MSALQSRVIDDLDVGGRVDLVCAGSLIAEITPPTVDADIATAPVRSLRAALFDMTAPRNPRWASVNGTPTDDRVGYACSSLMARCTEQSICESSKACEFERSQGTSQRLDDQPI